MKFTLIFATFASAARHGDHTHEHTTHDPATGTDYTTAHYTSGGMGTDLTSGGGIGTGTGYTTGGVDSTTTGMGYDLTTGEMYETGTLTHTCADGTTHCDLNHTHMDEHSYDVLTGADTCCTSHITDYLETTTGTSEYVIKTRVDDYHQIYVNGELLGESRCWHCFHDWTAHAHQGDVLAIYGKDYGGGYDVTVEVNGRYTHAEDWRCTSSNPEHSAGVNHWTTAAFDDTTWSVASRRDNKGPDAFWGPDSHGEVWCRYYFGSQDIPTDWEGIAHTILYDLNDLEAENEYLFLENETLRTQLTEGYTGFHTTEGTGFTEVYACTDTTGTHANCDHGTVECTDSTHATCEHGHPLEVDVTVTGEDGAAHTIHYDLDESTW